VTTCECGVANRDGATYCDSCGRRLDAQIKPAFARVPVDRVDAVAPGAIPRQRIVKIMASFIAVVLILAISLTLALRNVHIEISSNNLVSVQLPLNVCKTSVGDSSETPVSLPTSVKVDVPKSSASKLALYSDDEGVIEVLAPTGWTCSALVGADGSSSVTVQPAGLPATPSPVTAAEEVRAAQTSACVGCRESLACPLFIDAATDYLQQFQQRCPSRRPTSERLTTISPHVVHFTDPPGIKGDGDPSGGKYAAMGVMTYYDDLASEGSWTETCVLPPSDRSTCTAILDNFESKYGKR
jgi:Domain of unknown function (DUF4850)